MLDKGMHSLMNEFQHRSEKEYAFRHSIAINTHGPDTIILYVTYNGRTKEFLRMDASDYERAVRLPVQCSRLGNTLAQRFFLWHWLEEQNKLDLFFNTFKELKNA